MTMIVVRRVVVMLILSVMGMMVAMILRSQHGHGDGQPTLNHAPTCRGKPAVSG